jgi:hypothetical protein
MGMKMGMHWMGVNVFFVWISYEHCGVAERMRLDA